MRDERVTNNGPGEGIELALPGDTIRKRHIATRASNRRQIVVLVEGDTEFAGYSIGIDEFSLQILELPSGEVSTISLDHIVSITDGEQFQELSPEQKDEVDRRTASFRKTSHAWLVKNWPNVYDKRDGDGQGSAPPSRKRYDYVRPRHEVRRDERIEDDASQVRD